MESRVISEEEAAEFEEFRRVRRETEIKITLGKLVVDASRREADAYALSAACDSVRKTGASGILVSPVNVSSARRKTQAGVTVCCCVGGTGESLIEIKRAEAKRAVQQGAREIRLIPCYSALFSGNGAYLKREIKKVRRAVKKSTLVYSLEDHALGETEITRGIRAALEGKADAVAVRGETELVLLAVRSGAGKLRIEASGVENAEQLRLLIKAGAEHALTQDAERIERELYSFINGVQEEPLGQTP